MSWTATRLKASYRDQLIREVQHLKSTKPDLELSAEVVEVMDAIRRHQARKPSYGPKVSLRRDDVLEASDLYLLEATLIDHLEVDDLRIRVAGFRDMLSHLLTAESYAKLSTQFADLSQEVGESKLRAEAHALASRIYRRYEGVPAVEQLRRRIITTIFAIAGAILLLLLAFFRWEQDYAVAAWTGAAGALGASVSTMSRLYDIDARHEPFKTWLTIESGQVTLLFAPLVGAIFALVLLAIFRGAVITGILFPEFKDECWDFLTMARSTGCSPTLALDVAKLMLWGFAAGWGERMVPDVLDKLAPKTKAGIRK
jgi:hypothetical protein